MKLVACLKPLVSERLLLAFFWITLVLAIFRPLPVAFRKKTNCIKFCTTFCVKQAKFLLRKLYYFAAVQQTSTAKLPAFFQKFLKIVRALMVNEMKIYLHFVEHVCMELCFVWECSNIVIYGEHSVLFLNPYASYCPYDYRQSEIEDIFYRWLFVLQEFSTFFPVFCCYRITAWI